MREARVIALPLSIQSFFSSRSILPISTDIPGEKVSVGATIDVIWRNLGHAEPRRRRRTSHSSRITQTGSDILDTASSRIAIAIGLLFCATARSLAVFAVRYDRQ